MNNTKHLTHVATHVMIDAWQHERRGMNEETLASFLKERGWKLTLRSRRKGTLYMYARRRNGAGMDDIYIAPLSQINQLTVDNVTQKITSRPKTETAMNLTSSHKLRFIA